MNTGLRVTVWNEGVHERETPMTAKLYPQGMGRVLAAYLREQPGIATVHEAQLSDPACGLSAERLAETDVLTWWGHVAHEEVPDAVVDRVQAAVLAGMGLVVLHSGHFSKIFRRLMGTSCDLKWREWEGVGERERIWVVDPAHTIAQGLPEAIELPRAEMYGEHFDIPQPDQLVFVSWFEGGEVFRSGCCWHRGLGKIFYWRPGHETLPIYYHEPVLRVFHQGVQWCAPTRPAGDVARGNAPPRERMPHAPAQERIA